MSDMEIIEFKRYRRELNYMWGLANFDKAIADYDLAIKIAIEDGDLFSAEICKTKKMMAIQSR